MGISNLSALIIINNEVICDASKEKSSMKWIGFIVKKSDRWEPIISTEPYYDSSEEAVKAMEGIVKEIRDHKEEIVSSLCS